MILRRLGTRENVRIGGYAKFELSAPPQRIFQDDKPVLLYNPHFDRRLSSWRRHGPAIMTALESLEGWNVIIAPHAKLAQYVPPIETSAAHIHVDMGSRRSIDMSYTMSADIYLGDVSSQVYEFLIRPRPCIFLNLTRRGGRGEAFAHWRLGQVIEDLAALPEALDRAHEAQPSYEALQRAAMRESIDLAAEPASERQADIILQFAQAQKDPTRS